MADLLPLKFRILHYASKAKDVSANMLLQDLKDEYGSDGQFNKKMLTHHLDSLRAVGMIEVTEADFDANGELVIKYQITDYGKDRLKYLPPAWQN
ncbi:MAG: DNA-binding protein [Bacillota bacterium]|jgi:DNA-binding HxlR family transcriptional regulator|nr:DNA-binding protein [Clostridia bacterium]